MKSLRMGGLAGGIVLLMLLWPGGPAAAQMMPDGFITDWLLLGELQQQDGDDPGDALIRADHLTNADGSINEIDIMPVDGLNMDEIDYGGAAASLGFIAGARGDSDGDGNPNWFAWHDTDGHIDYNQIFGDYDNVMTYAVVYVINTTGGDLPVTIGCGSDDSIGILINDEYVHVNSVPRGYGGGVQDRADAVLADGINRVMVKVYEGGGGHNMGLRFEEQGTMIPLTEADGLYATLNPAGALLAGRDLPDTVPTTPTQVVISVLSAGDVTGSVTVREQVPPGWTVSNISDGGTETDGEITWTMNVGDLPIDLTYDVEAPGEMAGLFAGTIEGTVGGEPFTGPIGGEPGIGTDQMTGDGFIKEWLLLGEYARAGGANPGTSAILADYLTDGETTEASILPEEGIEIETDYCGASGSTGLVAGATLGDGDANGYPEWFAWQDADDTIDFGEVFGALDNLMTYACVYVTNLGQDPLDVNVGVGSDDSIVVYINSSVVLSRNVSRGWGGINEVQDTAPCTLLPGKNRLLVKIFEGGGGHGFRLRFQDDGAQPILGLEVSLDPSDVVMPAIAVRRRLPSMARLRSEVAVALEGVGSAAGSVTIRETVPDGWTITDAGGGTQAGQILTWPRDAADIGTITYMVRAPDARFGTASFAGTFKLDDGPEFAISGDGSVSDGAVGVGGAFGTNGYISRWLLLGPLNMDGERCAVAAGGGADCTAVGLPCCSAPGDLEVGADYLINEDGTVTQEDVQPFEGLEMEIDYAPDGQAYSAGLHPNATGDVDLDGWPEWIAWYDNDGGINYNDEVWPPDPQSVMAYAVTYVENTTGADMDVYVGLGSDDSIEVWQDDNVIWSNNVAPTGRGWAWPNVQDRFGPITLQAGVRHRFMTKVFEGWGGWNFYLGFFADAATSVPVTEGLEIGLMPEGAEVMASRTLDPLFASGVAFPVTIDVTIVGDQGTVTVTEDVPDGWTIANVSGGGSAVGQEITWQTTASTQLSYEVTPPDTLEPAVWMGTVSYGAKEIAIGGDARSRKQSAEDDVSPWIAQDIGSPLPGGVEKLGDDPFEANLWGSGVDIWGTADSFRYVYQEMSGSLRITAEVPYLGGTSSTWGKAGVMVRSSACPDAAYAFMHTTTGNGNDFQYRLSPGAGAQNAGQTGAGALVNWVRLDVIAGTATGYYSADGVDWIMHGQPQTLPLGDTFLVGLALTSHDAGSVAAAEFREVTIEELKVCPSDLTCTGSVAAGQAELAWRNHYDYVRIRVYRTDGNGNRRRIRSLSGDSESHTDTALAGLAEPITYEVVPVIGLSESPDCTLTCTLGEAGILFMRGDADGDGVYGIGDAIQILERLFVGRAALGSKCEDTGDVDNSDQFTIGDPINLLNYMFGDGGPPEPPALECGTDPSMMDPSCQYPTENCP